MRAWVVQELAVAQGFEFVCGNNCVSGNYFLAGFELYLTWLADLMLPLKTCTSIYTFTYWGFTPWWRTGWSFARIVLSRTFFRKIEEKPVAIL
jgi:hypothetical protein